MDTQNTARSPFYALEQWEPASHPTTLKKSAQGPFWGEDGFDFDDVLDMVNPLQHIPVASTEYRQASGDDASEGARLVGGVLFGVLTGGVLGVALALANAVVRHDTGKDLPEHALALLEDGSPTEAAEPRVSGGEAAVESADLSVPGQAPIPSVVPSKNPAPPQTVNFFVDDVLARSLHPAERLLAISSHSYNDVSAKPGGGPQQEPEPNPGTSMQRKISEAYRKVDAEPSGGYWLEV